MANFEVSVDGGSTTVRTTTVETRSTLYDDNSPTSYRSTITPRNLVINRTSSSYGLGAAPGSSRRGVSMERSSHYGSSYAAPSGAYSAVTTSGVNNVKESRDKEKKDMQGLNERLAGYIEKVRFLEAQNRRLTEELDKLKSKWGKETSMIKAMYETELEEARKLLDEAVKEKAQQEIKVASLEDQLHELQMRLDDALKLSGDNKEKIDRQNQQLADFEGEISLLRKRLESFETDKDRDKKMIAQLQDSLNRARQDLDNETLLHIDAENKRQTLEEEMEFLKSIHEQELKELSALANRDSTTENREFWKNEMGQALREIQECYDEKLDAMKAELETFYNLKINEFRTGSTRSNMELDRAKEESKRLKTQLTELRNINADLEARNQQLQRELDSLRRDSAEKQRELETENMELKTEVARLRAEMDAILKELQEIMDTKLGLELEIAAYRKLLEGEEKRTGLRQIIDSSWASNENSTDDSPLRVAQKGDVAARTTYQKTAKGPVSISECSADGKYIMLENTGRNDESMNGWRIKRSIDGQEKPEYSLDNRVTLRPGAKVKVWAEGCKPQNAPAYDVESNQQNWGTGSNIVTKLINPAGDERASHTQKTVQASS